MQSEMIRPIIGIENRTAQEVFDIMCDRFKIALSAAEPQPAPSVAVKALEWTQFTERSLDLNADSIEGAYVIRPSAGNKFPVYLWVPGVPYDDARLKPFNDLEAAKSHAQTHHERLIQSALSAQVQDVAGWQPIETAPMDGTPILGYGEEPCRRGGSHVRETRWEFYGEGSIAKERFKRGEGPSGSWGWQEPIHNWACSWEPTHWMPLPTAPAAPAKQEGCHD